MNRPEDARVLNERNIMPARGPRFFRGEDGAVQFQFVIDSTNIIGPRAANRSDQAEHAGAWAAFCATADLGPLDRDASGADGGSLPQESAPDPVADALTADFEAVAALPGDPTEAKQPPRAKGRRTKRRG